MINVLKVYLCVTTATLTEELLTISTAKLQLAANKRGNTQFLTKEMFLFPQKVSILHLASTAFL